MKAIVVVDRNWAIGRDGDLLVHLPGDLAYYKEKTMGNAIVMGRKTLESLPGGKPLPGRDNIVLTGNRDFCNDKCRVCYGMNELIDCLAGYDDDKIFISGGASLYQQMIPYCDSIYVTQIDDEFEADRFFPRIDKSDEFELAWQGEEREENGVRYKFTRYDRVKDTRGKDEQGSQEK